jgi:hypothetical protein
VYLCHVATVTVTVDTWLIACFFVVIADRSIIKVSPIEHRPASARFFKRK